MFNDISHLLAFIAVITLCGIAIYLTIKGTPMPINDFGNSFAWIAGGSGLHSAIKEDGIAGVISAFKDNDSNSQNK